MKNTLIVLNCAKLGPNEVKLWNSFYKANKDAYKILFYTTNESPDLELPIVIRVAYAKFLFPVSETELSPATSRIIHEIAEYDKFWTHVVPELSFKKAYGWYAFWLLVFSIYKPIGVYVWNGFRVPDAALLSIADLFGVQKNILERGPFANTFACDSEGFNYNSSFIKKYSHIPTKSNKTNIEEFAKLYFRKNISNWEQPNSAEGKNAFYKKYNIPEDKLLLFFPSQVEVDINSKLFSPNYKSVFDAYEALVAALAKHASKVFLLVKKHPKQEDETPFLSLPLPSGRWVDDAHIFDCIQYADAIVSINSSCAVEAALLGKPILLLGNSILETHSEVIKANSAGEIGKKLEELFSRVEGKSNKKDDLYLSKLLFGYLYSPLPEYQSLGLKPISMVPVPSAAVSQNPEMTSLQVNNTLNDILNNIVVPVQEVSQKSAFNQWLLYTISIPYRLLRYIYRYIGRGKS